MRLSVRQRQSVLGLILVGTLAVTAVSSNTRVDDGVVRESYRDAAQDAQAVAKTNRPNLDPAAIVRLPEENPGVDLFSSKSWLPPPPPPSTLVKAPPPAPVAPQLPFRYVGQMTGADGLTVIYLAQGEDVLIVRKGDQISGQYRLESLEDTHVTLTYLPLNQQQMLAIPPR